MPMSTTTTAPPPPRRRQHVYGTAGFRAEASQLPEVVLRTAFYAAHGARVLGKSLGLMLTASHNPAEDNGVKLVDPDGRMLAMECEQELTELVNATDEEFLRKQGKIEPGILSTFFSPAKLRQLRNNVDCHNRHIVKVAILIGTDTRPSSPALCLQAQAGVELHGQGVRVKLFERHTTPQLHFLVRAANDPSFSGRYVSHFRAALAESLQLIPPSDGMLGGTGYSPQLLIDCANGVGALWVGKCLAPLEGEVDESGQEQEEDNDDGEQESPVHFQLRNASTESGELLNKECGADFVKIQARVQAGFGDVPANARCASLDGDADRLVYFYPPGFGLRVRLLDGDHISALFATFIKQQFDEAKSVGQPIPLTFGIAQTAYANGQSTRYFREEIGIPPVCTLTGVKHLEEAARKHDIGLYFEANGHGTVCFGPKFHKFIKAQMMDNDESERPRHIRLLALFSRLVNEVVGDGIANLLAVECLLRHFDWSIQEWEANTYRNAPNVQLKVPVPDRARFECAAGTETRLARPKGMQTSIEEIVHEFPGARAFIRPSGTEQIVRVYAEAATEGDATELAKRLERLIIG